MELKTVPGVEIVSTGTYSLATGEVEFTEQHLADAVRASTDPTITSPRIKLGHDSKLNDVLGDGEPAFGQLKNLRLAKNGHTIEADLVNVPDFLADSLPAMYPGRSIEGGFDYKAPSGNEYGLVISGLALLGTEWPGVTSLADLQDVVTANGHFADPAKTDGGYKFAGEGVAASLVSAKVGDGKPSGISAKLAVGDFRNVFARDLRAGSVPKLVGAGEQTKWWPRSVEASDGGSLSLVLDDDAGKLIELPVEVEGEALKYGAPRFREAIAASGKSPRVLASWAASGTSPSTEKEPKMDRKTMIERLGLSEDATDEQIVAASAANPEKLTAETPPGDDDGGNGSGDESADEDALSTEGATLVTASGKKITLAQGMSVVDSDTLAKIKAGAAAGESLDKAAKEKERDDEIKAAIKVGKFAAGRREHYEQAWDADPAGTRALLASLAPGLVPMAEIGRAGDGESTEGGDDAALETIYARHFPELVTAKKES